MQIQNARHEVLTLAQQVRIAIYEFPDVMFPHSTD